MKSSLPTLSSKGSETSIIYIVQPVQAVQAVVALKGYTTNFLLAKYSRPVQFFVDADYDQLCATPEVAFILRSPVNLLRN